MDKRVALVNDKLGTMALGFNRAGYEIEAMYFTGEAEKDGNYCIKNWGDVVKKGNLGELFYQDKSMLKGIDCIAGSVISAFSTTGKKKDMQRNGNTLAMEVQTLIEQARPKSFLLRYGDIMKWQDTFCESMQSAGYVITVVNLDTRFLTGFPVNEKVHMIVGTREPLEFQIEVLKNVSPRDYEIGDFCEEKAEEGNNEIPKDCIQESVKNDEECFLIWNQSGKCYVKEKFIKWDSKSFPLIWRKGTSRKITHREIARLKGIPDDYLLPGKGVYQKLIHCPNVQVIQQAASGFRVKDGEKSYINQETDKTSKFTEIMYDWFEKLSEQGHGKESPNIFGTYLYEIGEKSFYFEFEMYRTNAGIDQKIKSISKKFSEAESLSDVSRILVVANTVEQETKKYVKDTYRIVVWDIENILWILEDFPVLKSEFKALLSFSISGIDAQEPEYGRELLGYENMERPDFHERLRKLKPGRDEAGAYEKLGTQIIKALFSDYLEFYDTQKSSETDLYRYDCCGKIKHGNTSEFFDMVQKFFQTKYIIFEFKNYTEEITQKEIYTTEKYLYEKALRKVAIIISRKGMDEGAKKAVRGSLREAQKLILCLSDEDINHMLDMKTNGEEPADYLEAQLDNMMLILEK